MAVKWKFRDGKWRRINVEFEEQFNKTILLSATIRAIYDKDAALTPEEQQQAIHSLPGMTISDMQSVIQANGPKLAATIRAIIGKDRATE
jgi:hypothetical protein